MGQTSYGTISIADITDTSTRLKYFFWPGDNNYPGVYAVGGTNNFDESDISTYGYNVRLTPATINIGYNEFPIIQVDGEHGSLNMFNLPYEENNTLVQGELGLKLDTNGLKVYKEINNLNSLIAEFGSYINIGSKHNNSNDGSAAIGVGLTTTKTNQIVVGRYNESNSNATFIIGDGTNSSNKSNLLTVGNIQGKQMTDTFIGDGSTGTFTLTNEPSQQPTISTSSGSYTVANWSGTTLTLNTDLAADVVLTVTYNMLNSGGYLVLGDNNEIHGENALVCIAQDTYSIKIQASGVGSSIHGENRGGEMIASGVGSSIHGENIGGEMTASEYGSSIHGFTNSNGIMTTFGYGSSIHGYAYNGIMTAAGEGSSIHGYTSSNGQTIAGGVGSSIYGYAYGGEMTASDHGSSIHGFAYHSEMNAFGIGSSIYGYVISDGTMTASGNGSSIHGYTSDSEMTASGKGSSIHGFADSKGIMTASGDGSSIYGYIYSNSTMTTSGEGSSIHGYTYNSTMTASGYSSSVHGYASESTMTASGNGSLVYGISEIYHSTMVAYDNGSIALNESTHALKRAQLAIGTFNEDDTASTTIHPSNNDDYGKYAFIIGNGTGEAAADRSNALTVDWLGNVDAAGGYKLNGKPLIQSGQTSTITVSANSYVDTQITFDIDFNSAPNVVVGFLSTSTDSKFGLCSCSAHSVTATDFTVRIFNADTSSRTPRIYYIATAQ